MDKNIDGNVSDVFGRCLYFIIAEIKDKKIIKTEAIKNKNIDQMGGVGVSTAQMVAEQGVSAVITGNVGPRATDILKQFNVKVYSGKGIIKEVLQQFIENKLEEAKKAGCEGCAYNKN